MTCGNYKEARLVILNVLEQLDRDHWAYLAMDEIRHPEQSSDNLVLDEQLGGCLQHGSESGLAAMK